MEEHGEDFFDSESDDDDLLAVTKTHVSSDQRDHSNHEHMMSGALPFGYFYMSAC
jgi:hypothetical protein